MKIIKVNANANLWKLERFSSLFWFWISVGPFLMLFSDKIWSNSDNDDGFDDGWTQFKNQNVGSSWKPIEKKEQKYLTLTKNEIQNPGGNGNGNGKIRKLKENPRVYRDKILFFMGGRWMEFRREDSDAHSHSHFSSWSRSRSRSGSDDSDFNSISIRRKRQQQFYDSPMDLNWREETAGFEFGENLESEMARYSDLDSDWRKPASFKRSVETILSPVQITKTKTMTVAPFPTPSPMPMPLKQKEEEHEIKAPSSFFPSEKLALSSAGKSEPELGFEIQRFQEESKIKVENEEYEIPAFSADGEEDDDDGLCKNDNDNKEPVLYYLTKVEFSPPLVKTEKICRENGNQLEKNCDENRNGNVREWISCQIPSTRFWISKLIFGLSFITLIFSFVEWSLDYS